MAATRIVVGLGNPGSEYARARHNVGFMVVERLADRWRIVLGRERNGLRIGSGRVADVAVLLVEPYLYMNLSGQALGHLESAWQTEDLIVVHDDIDLPVGRVRLRHDGGTGGHRGLMSITDLWGPNFDRVRIGVGRPPQGLDPADYVLQRVTEPELAELDAVAQRASDAVECLLANGIRQAMNRFNAREPEGRPAGEGEPGGDGGTRADAVTQGRTDVANENERETR